jgi:hypothetical protein
VQGSFFSNAFLSSTTTRNRWLSLMRWLLGLIVVCSALMVWSCLGCDRVFDSSKGLGIHQKSCKGFASTTRNLLLKRVQAQERPGAAKFARKQPSDVIGTSDVQLVALEVEDTDACNSLDPNVRLVSSGFDQATIQNPTSRISQ